MASDEATAPQLCPCCSGLPYAECCARLHGTQAPAPTAEALMRSRFSAFAVGDPAYLLRTWHPRTRPARLDLDGAVRWTRLEIRQVVAGGLLDSDGAVAFDAHYRRDGAPGVQSENSRFVRERGRWLYVGALDAL